MIGLVQRVARASVSVAGAPIAGIGAGLVVLVGIRRDDDEVQGQRLLDRVLGYRLFADDVGRMNRSLRDTGGGLLLVPQFTLAADTRKGTRASFTPAAAPADAERLFESLLAAARDAWPVVEAGRFGADMQVSLVNDGPVTFWLESR